MAPDCGLPCWCPSFGYTLKSLAQQVIGPSRPRAVSLLLQRQADAVPAQLRRPGLCLQAMAGTAMGERVEPE